MKTLEDYKFRKIPDYYDTMYLDGYTPTEIMYANKKRLHSLLQQSRKADSIEDYNVNVVSTIKVEK